MGRRGARLPDGMNRESSYGPGAYEVPGPAPPNSPNAGARLSRLPGLSLEKMIDNGFTQM